MAIKVSSAFGLVFLVPFLAIGVYVAGMTGAQLRTWWRVTYDYKLASCKILAVDTSISRSKHGTVSYYGLLKFELALENKTFDHSERVGNAYADRKAALEATQAKYRPGAPIECYYDPAVPSEIVLTRSRPGSNVLVMILFEVVWNVAVWGSAWKQMKQHRHGSAQAVKDERPAFNPSSLDDAVAHQTEWKPLVRGGANFCTHVLTRSEMDRVGFRPTLGAVVFYLVFLCVGVGVAAAGLLSGGIHKGGVPAALTVLLIGGLFGGAGGWMLWWGTRPIIFDRSRGLFFRGWSPPVERPLQNTKDCVSISDIHALQIVSEYCSGKSGYWSYELNLVLKDASRFNVVDHGNLERLRSDAKELASFLQVPVWDPA